jgi:acetyl-CoA synthetase
MLTRSTPREGPYDPPRSYDLSALRFIASVGEPLNPEAVVWGQDVLGLPVHDNWWQTETGCIVIANFAACEIRPGSMGRPLPGVEAAVLKQGEDGRAMVTDGRVTEADRPYVEGESALRPAWPSMFRGYLHDKERYDVSFADGWYTGDLVRRDTDGWYWFVGRADAVIKSAGQLIGPFEVESALMEHASVAEARVIGRPDPVAGSVVKACVSLRPGVLPTPDLERELLAFGRHTLGAAVAPREIAFDQNLPRTAAARSCTGCCVHVNSASRSGTCLPWRDPHESGDTDTRGRGRLHLPRARPRAGPRHHVRGRHGRDVRHGDRLQRRAGRVHAPARREPPFLRRQRHRRRR